MMLPARAPQNATAADDKRRAVAEVAEWFHSFDFGDGVVAVGYESLDIVRHKIGRLPDVRGKSVLDVNTWDGAMAFECERRGASRVVAMDHFAWSMDLPEHFRVWREHRARNEQPPDPRQMPYWRPDSLPGRAGFDTAHRLLNSRVEPVVGDLATMPDAELARLGEFDVVLYLGSLYHMADPLGALKRVYSVTAPHGMAIIETQAVAIRDHEDRPLCEVYGPTHTLNHDPTNHWAPNLAGLREMCLAAGFSGVETIAGPPSRAWHGSRTLARVVPGRVWSLFATLTPPIQQYRAWVCARR